MKILILQLKRIGDLILTTPVVRALREQLPQAELTLVTDATAGTLAKAIPVDHSYQVERGAVARGLLGFGPNAWIKHSLIATRFDVCLDFTGTDRSALLTLLSGSQRRITYRRFQKKFLRSSLYTDFVESSVRHRHTADHHTDLLQPLGITTQDIPLDLAIDPNTRSRARQLLAESGVTRPFAVIHAGTARPEKYWLPDRWARVGEALSSQHSLDIVLTGSLDAGEQTHLAAIKAASSLPFIDLSGRTNLLELAALISEARLFIGVDTAAMHLADAMRTPTVALFGPTNPFHWKPRHAPQVILRANTSEPFTPAQKGGPMTNISVDAVIPAAETLLR